MVVVFLEVAIDNTLYHTLIRICSLANGNRFQKEQDSLRRVLVGVVLAADLMNNVVAERHISERSRLTRRSKLFLVLLKDFLDLLNDHQVVRIRLAVYQVRPV